MVGASFTISLTGQDGGTTVVHRGATIKAAKGHRATR
jgi:hypothetical protein